MEEYDTERVLRQIINLKNRIRFYKKSEEIDKVEQYTEELHKIVKEWINLDI